MTPEQEKMLRDSLRLARENNDMLETLVRSGRRARTWKVLRVIMYAAVLFAIYYFTAPYFSAVTDMYKDIMDASQKFEGVKDSFGF